MEMERDHKIIHFLYNIQSRRRINPLYGIFTQVGLFYVIAGYIIFVEMHKGAVAFVVYLAAGIYIYKNKLNYRFYQMDRLYFYHMLVKYLAKREKVPSYTKIEDILIKKREF